MNQISSKTILMLTGAYVNHACWDNWQDYFSTQGYQTLAPAWPEKDAPTSTLRSRHPDKNLARLNLYRLIDHYTAIINRLPEKPILMGHSFGGLLAQLLLNRDLGAAAIAIHPVPPLGVIPYEFNFLRSNAATLGFFTDLDKPYLMPLKKWKFAFTNGLPEDVQQATYEHLVIPESKRVARGGISAAAKLDWEKDHAPLLILAGKRDQCIPPTLNKRNYEKYRSNRSVREFVLKDRNHHVLGLPTWKEDAADIAGWIRRH
ncbi:MAG: alpha/beta hydrolase [Chitinophagaceae bacterium]